MSISLKDSIPSLRPVRPWDVYPDGDVPFVQEFHVMFQGSDQKWLVRLSEEFGEPTAICRDQREAIRMAKAMAQARKADLVIHARDGSVEEVRSADELIDENLDGINASEFISSQPRDLSLRH